MYSVDHPNAGRSSRRSVRARTSAAPRPRRPDPSPARSSRRPRRARGSEEARCPRLRRARASPSRSWMVNAGPSACRCTTRKPSSDLPEKIGVDIVEPRPAAASPGRSVGVTGISPRAAIDPHTAFSVARRPAPARASRTPRSGRPFSGRKRSASAIWGQSIATTTASRCASSEGDSGSPSALIAWLTAGLDPAGSLSEASTRSGEVTTIGLESIFTIFPTPEH